MRKLITALMISSSLLACSKSDNSENKISDKHITFYKNSDDVRVLQENEEYEPSKIAANAYVQRIYNLGDSTVEKSRFYDASSNRSSTQLRHWAEFGHSEKEEFTDLKKIRLEKYNR